MEVEERDNLVFLFVGRRGSGKTDSIKELINKLRANFNKIIIADTFDSPVWHSMKTWNNPDGINEIIPLIPVSKFKRLSKGFARMFSNNTHEILDTIQENSKNTLVVIEDSRKFIKQTLTKSTQDFLIDSKQKNVDIILVFHSLRRVPTEVIDYADVLILKKTGEADVPAKWDVSPLVKKGFEILKNSKDKYESLTIPLN